MNEPGACSFWVQTAAGDRGESKLALATEDQEKQVVIMQVNTEHVNLRLIFRRTDFTQMLAKPNEAEPYEVAINIEEEA